VRRLAQEREEADRAARAEADRHVAMLRTHRAHYADELSSVFPSAHRRDIEDAIDAAIRVGGDRNEAAALLFEPEEVQHILRYSSEQRPDVFPYNCEKCSRRFRTLKGYQGHKDRARSNHGLCPTAEPAAPLVSSPRQLAPASSGLGSTYGRQTYPREPARQLPSARTSSFASSSYSRLDPRMGPPGRGPAPLAGYEPSHATPRRAAATSGTSYTTRNGGSAYRPYTTTAVSASRDYEPGASFTSYYSASAADERYGRASPRRPTLQPFRPSRQRYY